MVFYEKNKVKSYGVSRFYKIIYLPFSYDLFLLKKEVKIVNKSHIVKQDKILKQFNLKGFTEMQIEQILEKFQDYGKK
ncbi:MAG: hypothetical protein J6U64_01455, partial [Alphaproteobacteria bacterium]|nr:hypothetical protein [Alphaproteobacteria bacterium]